MVHFRSFEDFTDSAVPLKYLQDAKWGAGKFLHKYLKAGTFHERFGAYAQLFFAQTGQEESTPIIGFGALVDQDFIPIARYRPWVAFIYVDSAHRKQGLSRKIVSFLEAHAVAHGWEEVYIVTQHEGLYERFGYSFIEQVAEPVHERDYVYHKSLTYAPRSRSGGH